MKKLYSLIIVCFVSFLLTGCKNIEGGDGRANPYILVNKTNNLLYYRAKYRTTINVDRGEVFSFDTVLYPNDSLLLYTELSIYPGWNIEENVPFFGYYGQCTVTIKDDSQVLFYGTDNRDNGIIDDSFCGYTDFIGEKADDKEYWYKYYWTIDSEYIADKSCIMTDEEF